MSYNDRLVKLGKAWASDKAATSSPALPPGKYQFQIKRAFLEESKAGFNKGHLQFTIEPVVVTGNAKGRKGTPIRADLEAPATDKFPSGISRLKQYLTALEVEMPKQLTDKALKQTAEQLVGLVFNGTCVHNAKGYPNIYINDLVNAPAEADDEEDEAETEEETTEEEADEASDDAEDEAEEEPEEKPVTKKPVGKKPAPKKEEADDDWDAEFGGDK